MWSLEEVSDMQGRKWEILGVPFDSGSEYEGTGKAPEAIRTAGLTRRVEHLQSLGISVADRGDVEPPGQVSSDRKPAGLEEMLQYAPSLVAHLEVSLSDGAIPIVLGGDHSVTIASVAAVAENLRKQGVEEPSIGLLWVDAHPDFETPGPHSTNTLNAMPVTHILGRDVGGLRTLPELAVSIAPRNIAFIGLRDVLTEEKRAIHEMGIPAYTASDIERLGIAVVCDEAFSRVAKRTDAVVLTFDIDVLDPTFAPGVDYPELGGLTSREGAVIMEHAHQLEKLALVELVEVNPTKDRDGMTLRVAGQLLHRLIEGPLL
jgi:arginase